MPDVPGDVALDQVMELSPRTIGSDPGRRQQYDGLTCGGMG